MGMIKTFLIFIGMIALFNLFFELKDIAKKQEMIYNDATSQQLKTRIK